MCNKCPMTKFVATPTPIFSLLDPDLKSGQETYQYMELCRFNKHNLCVCSKTFFNRGRDLRPASVTSQLQSFYSRGNGHPMYIIGPLRVEVLDHNLSNDLIFHPGRLSSSVHHSDPRASSSWRAWPDHCQGGSTAAKVTSDFFLLINPIFTSDPRWWARWWTGQACLTIEESQNRSRKSIKLKPNPLLNLLQKAWLNETDSSVLGRLTERIGMFLNLNVTSRYHMI